MFHNSIKILFLGNWFAPGNFQVYFWIKAESHFPSSSYSFLPLRGKDDKTQNQYIEAAMTFTQKII